MQIELIYLGALHFPVSQVFKGTKFLFALWSDVCVFSCCSASTSNVAKLEEMERLLREAQAEKRTLLEHKVTTRSNHINSDFICSFV